MSPISGHRATQSRLTSETGLRSHFCFFGGRCWEPDGRPLLFVPTLSPALHKASPMLKVQLYKSGHFFLEVPNASASRWYSSQLLLTTTLRKWNMTRSGHLRERIKIGTVKPRYLAIVRLGLTDGERRGWRLNEGSMNEPVGLSVLLCI